MNRHTAQYINDLMLEFSEKLSDSVGVIKERGSEQEISDYLVPTAQISALIFDVLDLVHKQYPELKPDSFKD